MDWSCLRHDGFNQSDASEKHKKTLKRELGKSDDKEQKRVCSNVLEKFAVKFGIGLLHINQKCGFGLVEITRVMMFSRL